MRVLAIDIETSPCVADVWDLWNQNIGLAQLRESSELLCFAAKWLDDPRMFFYSKWFDGQQGMVQAAHDLLNEADAVLHYNGKKFDIPYLNKEFLLAGLTPPKPYEQVDLWATVKKRFRFPSTKLDYVSRALGFEGKVKHSGHELWVKVMADDGKAQDEMELYNKQDVLLLEQLYVKLLPWLDAHPNAALRDKNAKCVHCGKDALVEREPAYSAVSKFRQYQCTGCGTWQRSTARSDSIGFRRTTW
jgi:DNA polymerase elongation subunit (family B)